MKTTISSTAPSALETETLVAIVLDYSNAASNEKDKKPELKVTASDPAIQAAASELLASGEISGKPLETNLLHKPSSLKAKRLLRSEERRVGKECRSRGWTYV